MDTPLIKEQLDRLSDWRNIVAKWLERFKNPPRTCLAAVALLDTVVRFFSKAVDKATTPPKKLGMKERLLRLWDDKNRPDFAIKQALSLLRYARSLFHHAGVLSNRQEYGLIGGGKYYGPEPSILDLDDIMNALHRGTSIPEFASEEHAKILMTTKALLRDSDFAQRFPESLPFLPEPEG